MQFPALNQIPSDPSYQVTYNSFGETHTMTTTVNEILNNQDSSKRTSSLKDLHLVNLTSTTDDNGEVVQLHSFKTSHLQYR
jgi:hypothetical protein